MVLLWQLTESQVGGGVWFYPFVNILTSHMTDVFLNSHIEGCKSRIVVFQVMSFGVRTMGLQWSASTCTLETRWDTPPTCPLQWKHCVFSHSRLLATRQMHTPLWSGAISLWRSKPLHRLSLCKKNCVHWRIEDCFVQSLSSLLIVIHDDLIRTWRKCKACASNADDDRWQGLLITGVNVQHRYQDLLSVSLHQNTTSYIITY